MQTALQKLFKSNLPLEMHNFIWIKTNNVANEPYTSVQSVNK